MITFILIFAAAVIGIAAWLVANGANQRKRARQSGQSEVNAEVDGGGAPSTGRATGND